MTSGTEPHRNASTGVPHAMASIIKSKWLRPVHRKQQSGCLAQEFCFLALVDLPDELYARDINERQYIVAEVVFIDLVDLGGDLQRDAGGARYSDCAIRALFRRNPSQEGKVAPLAKRGPMQVGRNAVVDSRDKIGM